MPGHLTFSAHTSLYIALAMVVLLILLARSKRLHPLLPLGALLLALAAGSPTYSHPTNGTIAVMVDLSPSTRTATFRDRAALKLRINQLIGNHAYQTFTFSNRTQPLSDTAPLTDLPCDQTKFDPPSADVILLFSDGQFDLPPSAPPTYPVLDPALDHPIDSAVTRLQWLDHQVLATLKNPDPARPLTWTGASPSPGNPVQGPGERDFDNQQTLATPTTTSQITATLPPADPWPENDSLSITPVENQKQKLWIGTNPPPGWQNPAELPGNSIDFLQAAVVALNNIPAENLSTAQQTALLQYVRDLGGSLLLIGGDHAFAAGHYQESTLEDLSPLSSFPPQPAQNWLILIDASGSMAGEPWQSELTTINQLLPALPPHDNITLASFAKSLTIWPTTRPPANLVPTGPTNLAPALGQIASSSNSAMPTQLLLISDADTELPNPQQITDALLQKKIHLNLLAIGNGKALAALQQIAAQTHGSSLNQPDLNQWPTAAKQLLKSALPDPFQHTTIHPNPAPPSTLSTWNRTWFKPTATPLQTANTIPLSARWQLGLGKVISLAYPADSTLATNYADPIAIAPVDPRFKIKIDQSQKLHITINALQGNDYLNNQSFSASLDQTPIPIPQTAPGCYELELPSPPSPQILTVKHDQTSLNQFAISGRYPPEFEGIGNNLENLKSLANQTGGQIIPPGPVQPIDFHWPTKQLDLTSPVAFAGFLLIAVGMIRPHRKTRNTNVER